MGLLEVLSGRILVGKPDSLRLAASLNTSAILLGVFFALISHCSAQAPAEIDAAPFEEGASALGAPSGLVATETTIATTAAATIATAATTAAASPSPAPPAETPKPPPDAKQGGGLGVIKLFKNGGPVMWPLLVALLIAIGFSIERGIVFWKGSINVREFMMKVETHVDKSDAKGAVALCETTQGPVAAVIKAGLLRWDKGHKQVEKAIETAGSGAMSKLERGLPVLASVANIAPLMGFLGTVTGMIKSFGVIAKAGLSNPGLVAQGISEALITTASGLIIAIPALAAYNYFTSFVAKSALQMDESTSQLLDRLK